MAISRQKTKKEWFEDPYWWRVKVEKTNIYMWKRTKKTIRTVYSIILKRVFMAYEFVAKDAILEIM